MAMHNEPWHEVPFEPVEVAFENTDTLGTQEVPRVLLRPEEVVEMIPAEELSHDVVVALIEKPSESPGSWGSVVEKDDSLLEEELSSEEWRAWEADFHSSLELPALQVANEDVYALDHLLLSELTHLELLDSEESFANRLKLLLDKRSFGEWDSCELRPGTMAMLEGLFDRLLQWSVRYFVQREYGLALKLLYLIRKASPKDNKVLNNINKLETILGLHP